MTGELIGNLRTCPSPSSLRSTAWRPGGAVIALACDFRIAAENAKLAFPFNRVGLCGADMGAGWLLPQLVGLGRATEILMFGEAVPAARALEIGLVHRVVGDAAAARPRRRPWRKAGERSGVRARHDQDHAQPRGAYGPAAGAGSRSASAADLHADRRLPRGLSRLYREARAALFRTLAHAVHVIAAVGAHGRLAAWPLAREGPAWSIRSQGLAIPQPEPSPQAIVADLAGCGLLAHCVPKLSEAGEAGALPIGRLCLLRAALAYRSPLYDLMFVMQGWAVTPWPRPARPSSDGLTCRRWPPEPRSPPWD